MRTPAAVLTSMLAADPGRPRVTFYDDTPGPTQGERVELSARVLANWVAKAANFLQEEHDAGPATVVRLALPALHWRTAYWALATWSVGGTVAAQRSNSPSDILICTDLSPDPTATVVVTLAALARGSSGAVPTAALDEARELARYPDAFDAHAAPTPDDLALLATTRHTYAEVVADRAWSPGERVGLRGEMDLGSALLALLAAWAVDGSVVLQRGTDATTAAKRASQEGVTVDLG